MAKWRKQSLQEIIDARSIPEPNTGCLLWLGSVSDGYATITFHNFGSSVIRFILGIERLGSKIRACHKCDNRQCVEERHLYIGTHTTNMADGLERGSYHRGYKGRLVSGRLNG